MNQLKFLMHEKKNTMIFFLLDNSDKITFYEKSLMKCLNTFLIMYPEASYQEVKEIRKYQSFNNVIKSLIEPVCVQSEPPNNLKTNYLSI